MTQPQAHPLDIDLLGFALGDADDVRIAQVQEHLGDCLLCRIRIARMRRSGVAPAPLAATGVTYPKVSPEVRAVLDPQVPRPVPAANQLWLAGSTTRILVWVESVDDQTAYVHAAYLDVEAADDTSLLTRSDRLGQALAVSASVSRSIPLANLDRFVEDLPIRAGLKQVLDATYSGAPLTGVTTGYPIVDGADERLEFRQLLADDLAALDPIDDEGDDRIEFDPELEGSAGDVMGLVDLVRSHLGGEFASMRPRCEIHPIDDLVVASWTKALGFAPIATVHESAWKVLVVLGDVRDRWWEERSEETYQLMLAAESETLAVADHVDPYDTLLFDRDTIHQARQLPNATVLAPPRPLIEEVVPMTKALNTLLEHAAFRTRLAEVPTAPTVVDPPSLTPHLQVRARQAITNLRAAKAQLGKNRALKRLSESDAVQVAAAVDTTAGASAILDEIERVTGQ